MAIGHLYYSGVRHLVQLRKGEIPSVKGARTLGLRDHFDDYRGVPYQGLLAVGRCDCENCLISQSFAVVGDLRAIKRLIPATHAAALRLGPCVRLVSPGRLRKQDRRRVR